MGFVSGGRMFVCLFVFVVVFADVLITLVDKVLNDIFHTVKQNFIIWSPETYAAGLQLVNTHWRTLVIREVIIKTSAIPCMQSD